jgi:NhaP-type Na+/H+ or K+/H+ antiporter
MHVDGHAVSAAAIHFLVVAIGSLLVGLASGICCTVYYWMMHGCQTPLVEILMFCCWALLPYYVCDGIEWSGIVAVVTAGFVMDIYVVGSPLSEETSEVYEVETSYRRSSSGSRERRRRPIFSGEGHLSKEAKTHIGFVTEIIATMMETVIFAYLGLFLFSSRYHWNFYHTVIAILACCVSRAIMIPSLSTLANWITKAQQSRANWHSQELPQQPSSRQNNPAGVVINKKMQLVLWFAGLRGAMSFALVENIPLYDAVTGEGTRLKSELKAMTSASIIFTVFVLGGCTYYMMEGLGMTPQASGGNKHQHPSMLEREMEMIGLLSKRSHDEGREDVQWEGDNATDVYETKVKPAPSNSNIFRQRVQAL